jgi:quercetin dioxygenase-like cupin family protein
MDRVTAKIRRVVTANDAEGKSYVRWDSDVEPIQGRPGFSYFQMWATKQLPPVLSEEDPNTWNIGTSIGNGSVYRLCLFQPGVIPRWHKTDSVDYAIIVSGTIVMQTDKDNVRLNAGDVVVQQSTMHNWLNDGTEPCLILFVLISTANGESTGW